MRCSRHPAGSAALRGKKEAMEMRAKKGFTLMEMLIVVAIIAILTAIAIPVFQSNLEKSRRAVCLANRRSLLDVLRADQLSDETADVDALFADAYRDNRGKYVCPDGGPFHLVKDKDGLVTTITCDKHSDTQTGSGGFGEELSMKAILDAMAAAKGDSGAQYLDSNAAGIADSKTKVMLEELSKRGFDLDAMGAKTWKADLKNQFFFWTPADIREFPEGTQVPVIRYNGKTGTYTVWISTIYNQTKPGSSSSDSYMALNMKKDASGKVTAAENIVAYTPSTVSDKPNQSYAQALIRYQEALKKYPAP
jgi:prepilin-type N-terminal cleavage/methylation domain-containing protein